MAKFGNRWRALLRRPDLDRELDEEVAYHLDQLIQENLAAGMSPERARAAAQKSFGGVEQAKEECREARGVTLIENLARDLRQAARSLRRSPGLAAVIILSLGIGIGAAAAIFNLAHAVLWRSLPVRQPEQLVMFSNGLFDGFQGGKPTPGRVTGYSYPLFDHLRAAVQGAGSFEGVTAQEANRVRSVVLRTGGSDHDPGVAAAGRLVSGNYFDVIGVSARAGRLFGPQDDGAPGSNPVVLLSDRYWQSRFGGDPTLIGGQLRINGGVYTVLGVTPPGFTGTRAGDQTDFWLPMSMQPSFMRGSSLFDRPNERWLLVFGRLTPGAEMAVAQAQVNVALQHFLEQDATLEPALRRAIHIGLEPGARGGSRTREELRGPLRVLMAGVALLLAIVCLNVSHLLLTRAIDRHHEMAIRVALGASRGRLAQQWLIEGLLLAVLGAGCGLLLNHWLTSALLALAPGGATFDVDLSAGQVGMVALLTLVIGGLLALAPAAQAAGARPSVREANPRVATPGARRVNLGRVLLISQVAGGLVLLVAAGLLSGTLAKLRAVDKGFDQAHILLVQMLLRESGLPQQRALALTDRLVADVRALPGVRSASMSHGTGVLLRAGTSGTDIRRPDAPRGWSALFGTVTPGYFETMGIPLVRGRDFTPRDGATAPAVVIINAALARQAFGSPAAALGKRLIATPEGPIEAEVIGVVQDARTLKVGEAAGAAFYLPVAQSPEFLWSLEVRTFGDPAALADQVRALVRRADPALPVPDVRTLHEHVEQSLKHERLLALLSSGYGLAALFLICIGLYGVVSQWTSQRTAELGVRMALGATAAGVRWLVLRQSFALIAAGVALGLPIAVAFTRVLAGALFGVSAWDPTTFVGAPVVMFLVAALAAYLPARRASRIDPIVALRCE
jgi:predicted permease